jgi:hypothetical protein
MRSKASHFVPLLTLLSTLAYSRAGSEQKISAPKQIQQLQQSSAQLEASIAAGQARASQLLAAHQQAWQQAQQQLASAQALKTQQLLNSMGAPATPTTTTAAVKGGGLATTAASIRQAPGTGPTLTGRTVPPAISSLSVGEGQPGDPVLITGSYFGGFVGEVHFVVNPGMDLVAPVDRWSDTQILAHVPKAGGILRYVGAVYVTVPAGVSVHGYPSPAVQFVFDPQLDEQVLQIPPNLPDSNIAPESGGCQKWQLCPTGRGQVTLRPCNARLIPNCTAQHDVAGYLGNLFPNAGADDYYFYTVLKNGWIFESSDIVMLNIPYSNYPSCASLGPKRPQQPEWSPAVSVLWTTAPAGVYPTSCLYLLTITIKGPLGTSPF